ncbi:MAG: hypothetical protein ACE5IQ_08780 [Candidatus Methylomirabilales bacterium]
MSDQAEKSVMEGGELEKLTATKLRELCMEKYPEIQGVSGMKKEEIIEAIIGEEVRLGLRPKTDAGRPTVQTVSALKSQIRQFKQRRDQALAAQDSQGLREARAWMKRLKRRIRKLREAS